MDKNSIRERDLAPPDYIDPVVEYYKQFVDREALRENLKLVTERFEKHARLWKEAQERQKKELTADVPQYLERNG